MSLPPQTVALLEAARELVHRLPADAVLLLTETDLDWNEVLQHLNGCRLMVAMQDGALTRKLKDHHGLTVLEIDPGPTPTQERMSLALLDAVAHEQLRTGADVVVLYNGIDIGDDATEQIDSLSVLHLGEHLERLTAKDLRRLDTQVPLETLRAVVDLATEIGREGREGKPVGALFVVGDTRKVRALCRSVNYNPFRGYSEAERDVRDPRVREQLKEMAQLDGAILIRRDGIIEAGCMYIDVAGDEDLTLSKGLSARHWAAAAVSRKTNAVAVVVSQSSGTVRIFQNGEVVLRIEPLARPLIWRHFQMEAQDGDGVSKPSVAT
jgi:diadenylate cyclase